MGLYWGTTALWPECYISTFTCSHCKWTGSYITVFLLYVNTQSALLYMVCFIHTHIHTGAFYLTLTHTIILRWTHQEQLCIFPFGVQTGAAKCCLGDDKFTSSQPQLSMLTYGSYSTKYQQRLAFRKKRYHITVMLMSVWVITNGIVAHPELIAPKTSNVTAT